MEKHARVLQPLWPSLTPPSNFFPTFSHPKTQRVKRDSLLPAVVEREGNRRVTLNAWTKNSSILASTANICHPAPRSVPAPPGPLSGPHAPGVLLQPSPLGSPNVSDAGPRLFLSRLPHPHTARAPKTTLSVPIQWNVTARTPRSPPGPPGGTLGSRVQPRTQTSPCENPGHGMRDGDPQIPTGPPFYPPSSTSPRRESRTGRPHPPQDHRIRVISRLFGPGEGGETSGGLPTRPGPLEGAAQGRRPQTHPRPFLAHHDPAAHPPYLALRLGLPPLLLLLLAAAAAARGS